ncbi:MAG: phospholipase D-like domain-containing protein [Promethearchaeia archaeon]
MTFLFTNQKEVILKVLEEARRFINIIAFQFTSEIFINKLIEKSKSGVNIELITLPEDSYKKSEERNKIKEYFRKLTLNGIKIYFCDWEVGDPSLTTTSMSGTMKEGGGDKWYSLHGKLIITGKKAIISSLNFIDKNLHESYLILDDDAEINQFLAKYEKFKKLFINKSKIEDINGKLIEVLDELNKQAIIEDYKKINRKLVKQYPLELSPEGIIKNGLYIAPFEGRLRDILYKLIDNSKEFLYLTSERLFDVKLINKIGNKILNQDNIDLKILTGPPQIIRQNIQKAIEQFRQINVFGGEIRALQDLHAKFWLNEKYLIISSANLTKMNLGFKKAKNFWRSNTEFYYITYNVDIINSAKEKFLEVFKKGKPIEEVLVQPEKIKKYFGLFDYGSKEEAKIMLSKFLLKFTINSEQNIIKITKYAVKIARNESKRYVNKNHIIMGGLLLILQESSSTFREIKKKLIDICTEDDLIINLKSLEHKKFIKQENEKYLINVEMLLE